MALSDLQVHRYARNMILDEVGEEGQEKLLASRVLVVGAGGLGAPLLQYLAAAGVGTLGIVDDDVVELSNLQRQVIHATDRLGARKVDSAAAAIAAINPDIAVERHILRLGEANARAIVGGYDIVADGTDNFATRFLLNDACHGAGVTLVSAALLRFDGQLSTFKSHLPGDNPCYRCLYPEPPGEGYIPRCDQAGILGAVAGVMGTLQAAEVLKEILGLGDGLSGRLLVYDALGPTFRTVRFRRDPDCVTCGAPGAAATADAERGAA
jgi:adenylyltransferase/sulfurtransferase